VGSKDNMRTHNPYNSHDVENARAELALDQQEKERALEKYYAEKDLADDQREDESDDFHTELFTQHVEPRDRW